MLLILAAKTEVGRSLSLRWTWVYRAVPGQLGLCSNALSQERKAGRKEIRWKNTSILYSTLLFRKLTFGHLFHSLKILCKKDILKEANPAWFISGFLGSLSGLPSYLIQLADCSINLLIGTQSWDKQRNMRSMIHFKMFSEDGVTCTVINHK